MIQPVVKLVVKAVWQLAKCLYTWYSRLSNWLSNWYDNRLYRVYKHSTGCQTRLTSSLTTGFRTGCIMYTAGKRSNTLPSGVWRGQLTGRRQHSVFLAVQWHCWLGDRKGIPNRSPSEEVEQETKQEQANPGSKRWFLPITSLIHVLQTASLWLTMITFCVSRRRRKMYCGHTRLCVCLYAYTTARTRM